MKFKILFTLLSFLISANLIFGQFIVKEGIFQPTGLSNQGVVAGYSAQAGPYSIWMPDSWITLDIGGLAPGQGIGGQARFSDDGNFLSGTSYGVKELLIKLKLTEPMFWIFQRMHQASIPFLFDQVIRYSPGRLSKIKFGTMNSCSDQIIKNESNNLLS